MAKLYHLNPESGKSGPCRAQAGKCPFGSEYHFATKEEALAYAEELSQERYGLFTTAEKEGTSKGASAPVDLAPLEAAHRRWMEAAQDVDDGFALFPRGARAAEAKALEEVHQELLIIQGATARERKESLRGEALYTMECPYGCGRSHDVRSSLTPVCAKDRPTHDPLEEGVPFAAARARWRGAKEAAWQQYEGDTRARLQVFAAQRDALAKDPSTEEGERKKAALDLEVHRLEDSLARRSMVRPRENLA